MWVSRWTMQKSDRQSFHIHKHVIFKVKVLQQRNRKTNKCVNIWILVRHSVPDRKVKSEMFRLSVTKTDKQKDRQRRFNVRQSETERQTDREKFLRKSKLSCLCMQTFVSLNLQLFRSKNYLYSKIRRK